MQAGSKSLLALGAKRKHLGDGAASKEPKRNGSGPANHHDAQFMSFGQEQRLRSWYRGPIPPGATTPLSLLMVQGTPFCNIDCKYCYLPDRNDKRSFDVALLEQLLPKLDRAGLIGEQLSIVWHAGEPLVLSPDYYRDAFERVRRAIGPSCRVEHHFQTNALLINDRFCDLIEEYGVHVGVSIDGPEHLHDRNRVTRGGKGTHARAMEGIRHLQRRGINLSAICVLTRDSLSRPDEIYEFFVGAGIRNVGFNVEEVEGDHRRSTLGSAAVYEDYKAFMRRTLERVRADKFRLELRDVKPAGVLLNSILGAREANSVEANAFSILSVDIQGDLYTYSPELVGLRDKNGKGFAIGHVSDVDFWSIYQHPRFEELKREIDLGIDLCRKSCAFFDVCGGGSPVNKLSENGTFASTETMFCRLTRQAMVELAEDEIAAAIERRRAQRKAPVRVNAARTIPPRTRPVRLSAKPQPKPLQLMPGIQVSNVAEISERVRISSGTVEASLTSEGDRCKPGAIVPRQPWRRPAANELAMLGQRHPAAGPFGFVSLVKLPPKFAERLMAVGSKVHSGITRPEMQALSQTVPDELPEQLLRLYGDPGAQSKVLGLGSNPSGRSTITVDPNDELRIGLHLDSWSNLPIVDRSEAINRLCVNIGPEPRAILFINLPMAAVVAMLRRYGEIDLNQNPSDLGRAFMRRFPTYPVTRLVVHPGEAYIAPTENLIHDGDNTGQSKVDATFTIIGRFHPGVGSPKHADEEESRTDQGLVAAASQTTTAKAGRSVRLATEGDIGELVAMLGGLHTESIYRDVPLSNDKLAGFLASAIADPKRCVFVYVGKDGRIDGVIVGLVTDYFFSDDLAAYETTVYVRPERRGSMAAYRLWSAFKTWAREQGARHVWPGISSGITTSRTAKFYRGMGLEAVGSVFFGRLDADGSGPRTSSTTGISNDRAWARVKTDNEG